MIIFAPQFPHQMPHHRHFIIHKPFGFLSQFIYEQKRKKRLLGELFEFPDGTMAIGRLDEDSEGLLLLTTDGKVSEYVRSRKVEKEYYALVDGIITNEAAEILSKGVEIGFNGQKYITLPSKVSLLDFPIDYMPRQQKIRDPRHGPMSWVSVTVTEGKFRQVRKMLAAVGFPVLRLVRVRIGNIKLELAAAEVQEVDIFKID